MKRIWGPLGAAALLTLSVTACGGMNNTNGAAYDRNGSAYRNGTTAQNGGNVADNDGVTDFGDTDERSVTERASDALENGVRRARDGLENAKESMDRSANP